MPTGAAFSRCSPTGSEERGGTAGRPAVGAGWWPIGTVLAIGYLALAAFHLRFGAMNVDEGFYAAASRAVWQGQLPYQDFGYSQTPLLPYVNGLAMGLTGYGLFEQRFVNGVWALAAVGLAARLAARRAGSGAATALVAVLALTPAWMYFTNLGKTYSLTALVLLLALTVFFDWPAGGKKLVALSVLGVIGVGIRLPAAPFFAVIWLGALMEGGRPDLRRALAALGSVVGATAVLLLPFYLVAPGPSWFWTAQLHRLAVSERAWQPDWRQLVALAPAVWMLALVAALLARRVPAGAGAVDAISPAKKSAPSWLRKEMIVGVAAAVALAANLLPAGTYEEYGTPFLLPLALAAVLVIAPAVAAWPPAKRAGGLAGLLALALGAGPLLTWSSLQPAQRAFPSFWLPVKSRPYDFALAENVRRARETVQQELLPGQSFVGSAIILGVEANRPIPRRLLMGAFSLTSDFSPAAADRLHLLTFAELGEWVKDPKLRVFGLHAQPEFNFSWSVPSFRDETPDGAPPEAWVRTLQQDFTPASADNDFVVLVRR